ncbi:hypothetical protein D9758_002667 [Tetrapyrgos nigripes]|uniref:Bud22 domain-containing protein n=1 Tax=Tetrapyrgos nigripes TaxID=182062 RepID=A0A8H5GRN4_9AGAR|nr:hypothetical protein D9758_002667 [Tetrapyrgos nigripes]
MKAEYQRRGLKRKRNEPSREVPQKDIGTKVVGKLHHDLKEVRKAAKKAKTFETQKLVKKLKNLRLKEGSEHDINECQTQLEQLKVLSHDAVANTALRRRLTKDKVLSENESMQTALNQELSSNLLTPANDGTPASKIQNRLLSSKILAAGVSSAVEDLRAVVRPVDDSHDGDVSVDDELSERPRKLKKFDGKSLSASMEPGDGDVEMDLGGGGMRVGRSEQLDDEDVDAGGWESGTVGDDEREPGNDWESTSLIDDDSLDGYMDEDTPDVEDEKVMKQQSAKAGASKSHTREGQSTFLSSLSTGFVRGASDSDWSESEAKIADFGQKKNRRGQRARRAIWEKKYGRNANHKKKEATEIAEHGRKRWPGQASERRNHRGQSSQVSTTNSQSRQKAPQRELPRNESSATGSKPLHPSWEAKKRLKEKESIGIQPPPGRKIKFS